MHGDERRMAKNLRGIYTKSVPGVPPDLRREVVFKKGSNFKEHPPPVK